MAEVTLEKLNENINNLRSEIIELKARFDEEYELSEQTKKDLEEARKQMKEEFVIHEEIMKKYG
jgi:peptidoglycan hydrolase CwlO-like protein